MKKQKPHWHVRLHGLNGCVDSYAHVRAGSMAKAIEKAREECSRRNPQVGRASWEPIYACKDIGPDSGLGKHQ